MTLHSETIKQYVTNDVIGCDNKATYNKWYINNIICCDNKAV